MPKCAIEELKPGDLVEFATRRPWDPGKWEKGSVVRVDELLVIVRVDFGGTPCDFGIPASDWLTGGLRRAVQS
jgi:hypothetical protein